MINSLPRLRPGVAVRRPAPGQVTNELVLIGSFGRAEGGIGITSSVCVTCIHPFSFCMNERLHE